MVYYELGKYNEAISALKKAVTINPENGDTRAFLGFLYDLVGDGENAVLHLRHAIYFLGKDKKFHAKDRANQMLTGVIEKYGFIERDLPQISQ